MLDDDIWSRVVGLKGRPLETYVEGNANTIIHVEDTGSPADKVIIEERETYPTREDIVAACQLLQMQGSLSRAPDLDWLATPAKRTSAIVFRIVGEIVGDAAELRTSPKEELTLRDP